MLPDPHTAPGAPGVAEEEDNWSWLVTFSDLVLQLFGFAVIAALAGTAASQVASGTPVDAPAPVAERLASAAVPQPAEALPPAAALARSSDGVPPGGEAASADRDALPVVAQAASVPAAAMPAPQVAASPEQVEKRDGMGALAAYLEQLVALQPGLGATVRTERDAVVVKIGELAGFGPGSAEPSAAMRPLLSELRDLLGASRDLHVEVSGHTDDVPIRTATFPSNLELSLARASRVASALAGDDPVLRARVSAAGYADQRPVASNQDPDGRARNRRVEIRLTRGG